MIRFLQTPSPLKKIVLGAILLFIAVTMVVTLIPGIMTDTGSAGAGTLAKVGGEQITTLEVERQAREMGRRQFPRGFPDNFLPFLLQNAANSLILQKALLTEADRLGLRVHDAELRDSLHQGQFGQALFPNGNFVGEDAYGAFVAQNFNMTTQQFEQAVKSELVLRKLSAVIEAGVAVSDDEVRKEFQRQNTKVKLQYVVLTPQDMEKQVRVTDAELGAFFDRNKARYENSIPEKRKARYAVIQLADVLTRITQQLKPEEIESYYHAHQDEYRVPEQVKASHILIKTPTGTTGDHAKDQKAYDDAKAKAEDILKKLRAGADFAEMAKKESQDPGSAQQGGSLGWVQRGATVAEFEQALFAQPIGQVGNLVKSDFGFHIIRVEERQAAHAKPLAEVRGNIASTLGMQKAQHDGEALAAKVQGEASTAGLEAAAKNNKLQLFTTDWFGRSDSLPNLGVAPEFANAAFGGPKNSPPQVAKVPQGWAVVQATDMQPARTPTLAENKAKVEADFKQERATQLLGQKTQELADRAHAEHDLAKAAKALGATVKTSELVTPTSQVPDLGAMSGPAAVAFDMKQGEISAALNLGSSGAVVEVVEKQGASDEEFAKKKDEIRDQLLQKKKQDRMQDFALNLRTRMEKEGKIRINKDEWTRVMGAAPKAG